MQIAIDARELCGRPTGVGRYLGHLLDAWNDLPEARAHRFVLYAPFADDELRRRTQMTGVRVDVRVAPRFQGTLWEQASLALALRRDRPDVFFAPAYTAPLAPSVPVVLTVHDLSFLAHPEWFPPRSRLRRRLIAGAAARRARSVITD